MQDAKVEQSESSFIEQEILFLQLCSDGSFSFEELSLQPLLKLAQEKCQQVFHSTNGAARLRDLRLLLPDSTAAEPVVVVRRLSCLINLGTIRALVLHDRVLIVVPPGADSLVLLIRTKLEELSQGILDSNLTFTESLNQEDEEVRGSPILEPGNIDPQFSSRNRPEGIFTSKRNRTAEILGSVFNRPSESKRNREVPHLTQTDSPSQTFPPEALTKIEATPLSLEVKPASTTVINSTDSSFPLKETTSNPSKRKQHEISSKFSHFQHEHFELHALEAVLWTSMKLLEREHDILLPRVLESNSKATHDHSEATLDLLRQTRLAVNRVLADSQSQAAALTALTLDDRSMALLLFSHVLKNPKRYEDDSNEHHWIYDHDEIEVLFETYIQRFGSTIHKIRHFIEELNVADSNITIGLDISRNKLLKMNIFVTSITAFSGIGAFISGVFGMNLNSQIEDITDPPIFWIITGMLFAFFFVGVFSMVFVMNKWI